MVDTAEPAAGEPWWLAPQLTRAQQNSLTDDQLLARYRHRHGYPYMPLSVAKQMWRAEARYAHLGVASSGAGKKSSKRSAPRCAQGYSRLRSLGKRI